MQNQPSEIDKLNHLISKLEQDKFYGELAIRYESGKVVVIRKTESIKL